jgi:hypothetical protein
VLAHATAAYRTFAESGGDRPDLGTPAHLAERRRACDAARQELAAAQAARAELGDGHAAAQREHERCERAVAAAADGVIAEMSLATYVRYTRAVEAAREAWDDLEVICAMTVSTGPRWVDRTPLPGLPPGLAEVVSRGFGHRDEPPLSERVASRRSAAWEDLRHRLRLNADASTT